MREFVDFLGSQSPYDALLIADLETLARAVEVEYFVAGTVVVEDGAAPMDHLYVVRTGAVEIVDRGRVVNLLGQGDTFGHVSVLSGLPPALQVRAVEDTLTYRLPDPRTLLEHPERLKFTQHGTSMSQQRLTRATLLEASRRPVSRYMRPVVWADPHTTVRDAARLIDQAGQSCVLVAGDQGPGIATDQDFRRMLAGTKFRAGDPVAAIASFPALAVQEDTSVTSAFLEMIEHGVHHLTVHNSSGRPVGVLRVVDLASAEVRDPLLVRSAIEQADTVEALAAAVALLPGTIVELSDCGLPPTQVGALLSAIMDTVLGRLIEMDQQTAGVKPSWMVLGSLARREALPGSDVDTALVWADPIGPLNPAEEMRASAERVLTALERCGLRRCPDGGNATNPLFSRSVSDWTVTSARWIRNPTSDGALLLASMIADSRPVSDVVLGRAVTESMQKSALNRDFLSALLRFTLMAKPPAGFVRNFVVEHSGEHRGQLDLKRGGLLPVASLGRWIALVTGDSRGNTPDRIQRGAQAGLLTAGEADALVGAFEQVYDLLFEQEVAGIRSGRQMSPYVAPRDLDPLTRRFLRETFREIGQIQGTLEGNWVARMR